MSGQQQNYISEKFTHGDPYESFLYALKAPETKRQYPKRLKVVFDYLVSVNELKEIQLENQCKEVVSKTLQNPHWLTSCLMRFIIFQNERIKNKEIVAITAYNYIRSLKLFIDMNFDTSPINWKKITLSYGRNYITKEDIFLVIKVVLSTGSIERVLILDLLIANNGTLTTSQITQSMRIANNTAKRTMVEFKGLELVTMDRVGNNSNSEYRITLNPKFKWFLTKEFADLRDGFNPVDYKEYLNLKTKSAAVSENTLLRVEQQEKQVEEENIVLEDSDRTSEHKVTEQSSIEEESIKNITDDTHKGESTDSKRKEVDIEKQPQESIEKKYLREQEEIKNWNKDLE